MKLTHVIGAGVLAAFVAAANAGIATNIDFSFEDDGVTPLVNGQKIDTEFGNLFTLSSSGNNQGLAIFDSDPAGPNAGGGDEDLLVGLGNLLTLQSNDDPGITGGIFDTPNDSAQGGNMIFSFLSPVQLNSIVLVDLDITGVNLTMTDGDGLTRTYNVPSGWTKDIEADGPDGFAILDLTSLADQAGEFAGILATASEDAGFNPAGVVELDVNMIGSGAIDNLTFVPTPGAAACLACAGLVGIRRRRA